MWKRVVKHIINEKGNVVEALQRKATTTTTTTISTADFINIVQKKMSAISYYG